MTNTIPACCYPNEPKKNKTVTFIEAVAIKIPHIPHSDNSIQIYEIMHTPDPNNKNREGNKNRWKKCEIQGRRDGVGGGGGVKDGGGGGEKKIKHNGLN